MLQLQAAFHPIEQVAVHRQITVHLRGLIQSGQLPTGMRLPPIHEMARQFETSYFTMQTALTPLVQEGLLDRKPRRGTVVRGRTARLTSVGVYFGRDFWTGGAMAFYRKLYATVQAQLAEEHIACRPWIDARLPADQAEPLPQMVRDIKNGKVQCVIVHICNRAEHPWLQRLPVPKVFLSSYRTRNRVVADMRQMIEISLAQLKAQGCRTVGVISILPRDEARGSLRGSDHARFYDDFSDVARRQGLTVDPAWIRGGRPGMPDGEFEAFGYEQFVALWHGAKRPRGLLVWPDVAARGVVTAVLASGVRVPEDMELVLHQNEGLAFACPLPAHWVVSSADEVGRALISQAKHVVAGDAIAPAIIPFRLVEAGVGSDEDGGKRAGASNQSQRAN